MALYMIAKTVLPVAGLAIGERYIMNNYGSSVPLVEEASVGGIPKAFGLVVIANVVASGIVLLKLGMKVGAARKKYGVELPLMYSSEKTDEAKKFNCVQRGHQQALESYPSFLACSLIGGIKHPFLTATLGLVWCVSRLKWAEGYATGEPMNRYGHSKWGRHIWTAYLGVVALTVSTGVGLLL